MPDKHHRLDSANDRLRQSVSPIIIPDKGHCSTPPVNRLPARRHPPSARWRASGQTTLSPKKKPAKRHFSKWATLRTVFNAYKWMHATTMLTLIVRNVRIQPITRDRKSEVKRRVNVNFVFHTLSLDRYTTIRFQRIRTMDYYP